MKRRLSLGVALAGQSDVVFLDEPTTGLDPVSRRHVWQILESARCSGRALVLTTHSMDEVSLVSRSEDSLVHICAPVRTHSC